MIITPTRTQQGGFLGTLIASIGVPLLLNALTGKGLQADRTGTTNTMPVYVPGHTTNGHGMINHMHTCHHLLLEHGKTQEF